MFKNSVRVRRPRNNFRPTTFATTDDETNTTTFELLHDTYIYIATYGRRLLRHRHNTMCTRTMSTIHILCLTRGDRSTDVYWRSVCGRANRVPFNRSKTTGRRRRNVAFSRGTKKSHDERHSSGDRRRNVWRTTVIGYPRTRGADKETGKTLSAPQITLEFVRVFTTSVAAGGGACDGKLLKANPFKSS